MGDLTCAIILGSINLGYFSGTAQDGLVYIPREGPPTLMIKKSLELAADRPFAPAAKEPAVPPERSGYSRWSQDRPGAGYTALWQLPPAGSFSGRGCKALGHLREDQANSICQVGF